MIQICLRAQTHHPLWLGVNDVPTTPLPVQPLLVHFEAMSSAQHILKTWEILLMTFVQKMQLPAWADE